MNFCQYTFIKVINKNSAEKKASVGTSNKDVQRQNTCANLTQTWWGLNFRKISYDDNNKRKTNCCLESEFKYDGNSIEVVYNFK